MSGLYPEIEPCDQGMLDVGGGQLVYWEVCGNPDGKPAVVMHGGPGTGCTPGMRRYFDPAAYWIVLFDQRGCGRSTPHASDPAVDLSTNTTQNLIADTELLRSHLGIDSWLVFGGSWSSTLGLAYAQMYPERVTEIVLVSITSGTRREVEWITQDMSRVFPAEWARFRDGVPESERDSRLVDAYSRLLEDPEPAVREKAARDWCAWEDAHVAIRKDHKPRLTAEDLPYQMAFARLVTHYWRHDCFLEDGIIVREAGKLAGIPGVLVHGRIDISGPPDIAWHLAQAWPDAELTLIDDAGHGTADADTVRALVAATDRFAAGTHRPRR
jgi:proline iminopeptidase